MSIKSLVRKTSTSDLLKDLAGYRRGTKYYGGKELKSAIAGEVKRRKELGLIRKDAGIAKKRTNNYFTY